MERLAPHGGLGRPLLIDAVMDEEATHVSAFSVPAGTVTFLLTDVEGSTRLWESAPTAMPQAIARHYEILDEAIARHGGVRPVEQGEGDSIVAAFTRARDAVASALAAQRAFVTENWPSGAPLRVRMALHTGDAQLRDEGNYFGGAVNRCARLRAIAHGGQVLLSGATAELVADHLPEGADLVNLGVHRLRDLGRPERVFALSHPDLPEGVPPPRSLDQLPNNLPNQVTSFVGRRRELAELGTLLASTHLLTLTGAGGCGKTRLAMQLAADSVDRYPGGAWCLELAPLSDPTVIESALAAAVGVRLTGHSPVEAVIAQLVGQRALVLLDNCEHVLEPCIRLAGALLRKCPDMTILATSREPLGVAGETTWRVPSLSLPTELTPEAPRSLDHSDAVRLFIERAAKVRPNFAVTNDNAPHVAQICQALDGIPLAIELAAARVRVLSTERIAAGLADRFRLLTGGARGALPRLQTLRASVDWSHELLNESERSLLRRLGVFHGGFTLDACEAVCADELLDPYAILDLLTSLVDKSLVLLEERDTLSRYTLLETVRQYAGDRLVDTGELDQLRERHAAFFVALAERARPQLADDPRWWDLLGADAPNLYAVIDHTSRADPDTALRLCTALGYWWTLTGRLIEARAQLTQTLEATADRHSSLRCGVLAWLGYLRWFTGEYELAHRDATEALALAEDLGDRATEARALGVIGLVEMMPDPRNALTTLERSADLSREVGDYWGFADVTQNAGWALFTTGEHSAARANLEAAFKVARDHGLRDLLSYHWFFLGLTVYPSGDLPAARAIWESCPDDAAEVPKGCSIWSLGVLDVDEGKPMTALERLTACKSRVNPAGGAMLLPFLDGGIARAHAALGRLDEARTGLRSALQDTAGSFTWLHAVTQLWLAQVERLRGDLTAAQAAAQAALAVGEDLGNPNVLARAQTQLARIGAARQEWGDAEKSAHEALAVQAARGEHLDVPDTLDALAEIAAGMECFEEAARVLGAADRARTDLGLVRWQPEQERTQALVEQLRDALGEEALTSAIGEGQRMSIEGALEYTRRARGTRKRPSSGWQSLTPTELEVVRHAAAGLTNPEIAKCMFVSRGTVKVHLSHIYAKLGTRNRAELTAEAMRRQHA